MNLTPWFCRFLLQIHSYMEPAFLSYIGAIMVYSLLACYCIIYSKSPVLRRLAWGTSGGALTGLQNFLKDTLVRADLPIFL